MSDGVLAVSRADVADYVEVLILVYIVLILIRVIVSYFTRIPYSRPLDMFLAFVTDVTEPYLALFRRFIPPLRLGPAALDLTPMIATFVLIIVGLSIVVPLIRG